MGRKKALSNVEDVLKEHGAEHDFETLVKAGCNRGELIMTLELAFLADESWETLVGMDLRSFKTDIAKVRHCADLIERLNRTELIYRVSTEGRIHRFAAVYDSPTLPERLHEYASNLNSLLGVVGPKPKHRTHAWKASIVAIVRESTGKDHDKEVSALIAAVLNHDDDDDYSVKAHQAWRAEHKDEIERMQRRVRERWRKYT